MDTFAHAAAGAILFSRPGYAGLLSGESASGKNRWFDWTVPTAALFGMLPDLLSFSYVVFKHIFNGGRGKPPMEAIPDWVFSAYNMTHSLFLVAFLVIMLLLINRHLGIAALAWPFHVLCDIPTHSKAYFPTPFLYPFSSFTVDGISFMRPYIFFPYWSFLLISLFWLIWLKQHRSKLDK
ncbi:MAG: hypothetical protein WC071_07045 [Victivallaceae bacterium]